MLFLIDPHLGTTISWILTNIAYPLALSETVIFWFLEYLNSTIKIGGFPFYLVLHVHTFQVLFTLEILSIKWQALLISPIVFKILFWYKIFIGQLRFHHLLKTMIAILDTIISSRPWKLGHFYCCILFALVYTCFQLIFVIGMKGENEVENQ